MWLSKRDYLKVADVGNGSFIKVEKKWGFPYELRSTLEMSLTIRLEVADLLAHWGIYRVSSWLGQENRAIVPCLWSYV